MESIENEIGNNNDVNVRSYIFTGFSNVPVITFSIQGESLGENVQYIISMPFNLTSSNIVWECPCGTTNNLSTNICTSCQSSRPVYVRLRELPLSREQLVSNLQNIQFYRNQPLEDVKINLTHDEFLSNIERRNMGKTLINELNIQDRTCCICMERIKDRQHTGVTKCKHIFHYSCIQEWLTSKCTRPTCPCCRNDLRE